MRTWLLNPLLICRRFVASEKLSIPDFPTQHAAGTEGWACIVLSVGGSDRRYRIEVGYLVGYSDLSLALRLSCEKPKQGLSAGIFPKITKGSRVGIGAQVRLSCRTIPYLQIEAITDSGGLTASNSPPRATAETCTRSTRITACPWPAQSVYSVGCFKSKKRQTIRVGARQQRSLDAAGQLEQSRTRAEP